MSNDLVTREAVEVAARRLYLAGWDGAPPWESLAHDLRETFRDEARVVIEAALEVLQPKPVTEEPG